MYVVVSDKLTDDAVKLRNEVFVTEQGFVNEFDDTDRYCEHYIMYDSDTPVAVCRTYISDECGCSVIGRVAVTKDKRGRGLGRSLISFAEDHLREKGEQKVILHSQSTASGFYSSLGYSAFGEEDEDEGVPHIWMEKHL